MKQSLRVMKIQINFLCKVEMNIQDLSGARINLNIENEYALRKQKLDLQIKQLQASSEVLKLKNESYELIKPLITLELKEYKRPEVQLYYQHLDIKLQEIKLAEMKEQAIAIELNFHSKKLQEYNGIHKNLRESIPSTIQQPKYEILKIQDETWKIFKCHWELLKYMHKPEN